MTRFAERPEGRHHQAGWTSGTQRYASQQAPELASVASHGPEAAVPLDTIAQELFGTANFNELSNSARWAASQALDADGDGVVTQQQWLAFRQKLSNSLTADNRIDESEREHFFVGQSLDYISALAEKEGLSPELRNKLEARFSAHTATGAGESLEESTDITLSNTNANDVAIQNAKQLQVQANIDELLQKAPDQIAFSLALLAEEGQMPNWADDGSGLIYYDADVTALNNAEGQPIEGAKTITVAEMRIRQQRALGDSLDTLTHKAESVSTETHNYKDPASYSGKQPVIFNKAEKNLPGLLNNAQARTDFDALQSQILQHLDANNPEAVQKLLEPFQDRVVQLYGMDEFSFSVKSKNETFPNYLGGFNTGTHELDLYLHTLQQARQRYQMEGIPEEQQAYLFSRELVAAVFHESTHGLQISELPKDPKRYGERKNNALLNDYAANQVAYIRPDTSNKLQALLGIDQQGDTLRYYREQPLEKHAFQMQHMVEKTLDGMYGYESS